MTYQEILDNARSEVASKCRVCPVCDGRACRGEVPGVGGKGSGAAFIANVQKLAEVKLVLDTLYESRERDTTCEFFGKKYGKS